MTGHSMRKNQRNLQTALPIAARTAAAVLGGYALSHTLPIALGALLPLHRADAVLFAMQLSFFVFCAAILWAFAARSIVRAWVGLVALTAVTGLASSMLL